MKPISPKKAFYIKLGKGGKFEQYCLDNNFLQIGYREISHDLCTDGNWNKIQKELVKNEDTESTAKNHIRQLRTFYEEDENTLWITFINEKLYWCFSNKKIVQLEDKSKIRPVIGSWCSTDIQGNSLDINKLSGKLTRTQAYRGTICPVKKLEYLVKRINCEKLEDVQKALSAKLDLKQRIEILVSNLQPLDFEILVELIFSRAGLQKISMTGKTRKLVDIVFQSPITDEQYSVQVKSKSNLEEFFEYKKRIEESGVYNRFFFVVHSPNNDLKNHSKKIGADEQCSIWLKEDISEMSIKYGLVDWIIDKSS